MSVPQRARMGAPRPRRGDGASARVRLAVLVSGAGSNMTALAAACARDGYPARLALVASDRSEAPALGKARALGLATWSRDASGLGRAGFEAALDEALQKHAIDLVALAGFMRILSGAFVGGRWSGRILNLHPSLLPKFRGLDAPAQALAAGERVSGATVHLVTGELDAGPILGRIEVAVAPDDTPETLHARIRRAEHRLYPEVVAAFARATWPDRTPEPASE